MDDPVQHPRHYTYGGIEVIDIIESYNLNFLLGNVIKYVLRAPFKNGLEDYKKAQFYLNRYILSLEKANDNQAKGDASGIIQEDKPEV
jgi:hypothetical protein